MPLKHATETFLIFLLAAVIAVTGIVATSVPPLPAGAIPWMLLLLLSFAYPLGLMPLFRKRRADYHFRLLHWIPAVMLLAWFVLHIATYLLPSLSGFARVLTWGWMFPWVTGGIALLAWFSFAVLRRWQYRMVLLAVAFVPFAIGAVTSELTGGRFEQDFGAVVWQGNLLRLPGRILTAFNEPNAQNVSSSDPAERAWREQLHEVDNRSSALSVPIESSSSVWTASVASASTSSDPMFGSSSSRPSVLPHAGADVQFLLLSMFAVYCALLHDRARRRLSSFIAL